MAKNNKHPNRVVIGTIAALAFVCLVSVQPVAAAGSFPAARAQATPMQTPTPAVTPQPTDTTSTAQGDASSSSSDGGSNPITQILNIFVQFANDTVASGINFALWSLSRQASMAIGPEADKGINLSIHRMTTLGINDQSSFIMGESGVAAKNEISPMWNTMFGAWGGVLVISSFLLPVTLLATVIFALRGGMSSFTARADAKQALSDWISSVAFAGASYFLLFQGFRLSAAITGYVNESFLAEATLSGGGLIKVAEMFAATGIAATLLNGLSILFMGLPVGAVVMIFLGFFFIIGVVTILLAFALAALAKDVIIFIVVASAPLVCVLSAVPQFRWVFSAWLKVAFGSLAMVPLTAMLWRIGGYLVITTLNKTSYLEVWDCFYAILLWVGFASIIVGIYGFVGKFVYAAAMDVWQKAEKATKDTIGLAVKAAGLATGSSLALASSGTQSSGDGDSGSMGGSMDGLNSGGGGSGRSSSSSLNSAPSALASFMKSSNLPLLSDFGVGMESGLRMGSKNSSSLSSKPSAFTPHPEGAFPGQEEAVQKLKSEGLDENTVRSRINGMSNAMHSAEKGIGLSANDISTAYGHNGLQETFEAAGRSPNGTPSIGINAPIRTTKSAKLQAFQATNQIVASKKGSLDTPQYSDALSTVYSASTLGGAAPQRIVDRACSTKYDNDSKGTVPVYEKIEDWWKEEQNHLRQKGLA